MRKTIRPDGSLDPVEDFEDDGASFRVRREAQLQRQFQPKGWSWRYLMSSPRSAREAVEQPVKIAVKLAGFVFLFVAGFVGGALLLVLVYAIS